MIGVVAQALKGDGTEMIVIIVANIGQIAASTGGKPNEPPQSCVLTVSSKSEN